MLVLCALAVQSLTAAPFAKNDVVVFLGDSETHCDRFVNWFACWCATRHPDLGIKVVNAGVGGDTAGGALCRLEDDVLSKKPTVVYVMFGGNDLGWHGVWTDNDGAKQRKAQADRLADYEKNLTEIVHRLRAASPKIRIILSSTFPYEDAARLPSRPLKDRDDAFVAASAVVRGVATREGVEFVDLYSPMAAFSRAGRNDDPSFTVSGDDRVHPNESQALFVFWALVRALGEGPLVSRVSVNAAKGTHFAENATVANLEVSATKVAFTLDEKALPFPTDTLPQDVIGRLPFAHDLSREELQVTGLEPGRYALAIDGAEVGVYDDISLSLGVNVGESPKTPQALQAKKVLAAAHRRHQHAYFCRDWYWARYSRLKDGKDPNALDEIRKGYRFGRYFEARSVGQYIEELSNGFPSLKELAAAEAEMTRLAVPVPHRWSLVRVGDGDFTCRVTDQRLTNAVPVATVSANGTANGQRESPPDPQTAAEPVSLLTPVSNGSRRRMVGSQTSGPSRRNAQATETGRSVLSASLTVRS